MFRSGVWFKALLIVAMHGCGGESSGTSPAGPGAAGIVGEAGTVQRPDSATGGTGHGTDPSGRAVAGQGVGGTGSGSEPSGGRAVGGAGQGEGGIGSSAGGSAAGGAGEGGARSTAACEGDYVACGCGCCGDEALSPSRCYYPAAGEDLQTVRLADEQVRANSNCAVMGCSAGVRYVCCLSPEPDSTQAATYSATYWAGGLDHLGIDQVGQDGRCASLSMSAPGSPGTEGWALELPPSWGLAMATRGPCDTSADGETPIGAEGSVVLRAAGDGCVVDVHAALFFERDDGTIEALRLDADALELGEMAMGCS